MPRCGLLAIVLLGVASMPPAALAEAPLELKSVTIELPFGDKVIPPGPGSDEVSRNCFFCHSAGMLLYQPAMPKSAWIKIIHKMIDVYKAPVAEADIPAIVNYLTGLEAAK